MNRCAHQHGDVILVVVDGIPEGAKQVKVDDGFIVERGEGVHTHTLVKPEIGKLCDKVVIYEKDGTLYMRVKEAVQIDHEEHGKQTIKPGIYKKVIEQVMDYDADAPRRVAD